MEQVRIVKEMRDADGTRGISDDLRRPRYMVWENVPGAFSSAAGEDFRAVLGAELYHIVIAFAAGRHLAAAYSVHCFGNVG